MKHFVNLFLILSAILLIQKESAIAQLECPPGYLPVTISVPWNGCEILTHFCLFCSPTGTDGFDVKVIFFEYPYPCEIGGGNFQEVVMNEILQFIMINYPQCGINPCNPPGQFTQKHIEIAFFLCYKQIYNADNHQFTLVPCYDEVCYAVYKICVNFDEFGLAYIDKVLIDSFPSGPPQCLVQVPIPPTGKTWSESWESDCFQFISCPM